MVFHALLLLLLNSLCSFLLEEFEFYFVAAPTCESQASDALLALAKMQPLSAVGMKLVSEQEIEDLKNQASVKS